MKKSYVPIAVAVLVGMMCGVANAASCEELFDTSSDREMCNSIREYGFTQREAQKCVMIATTETVRSVCQEEYTPAYEKAVWTVLHETKREYQKGLLLCIADKKEANIAHYGLDEVRRDLFCRWVHEKFRREMDDEIFLRK